MAKQEGSGRSAGRGDASAPKYVRIAKALEEQVQRLSEHDPVPTERQLMADYGVSRMTVRRAIAVLLARGLVYNIQGSGTYVAPADVVAKTLRLTGFSEDMRQRGLRPTSLVLASGEVSATGEIARRLNVPAGTLLVAVERLRLADEIPMALEDVRLIPSILPAADLNPDASLYKQLEEHGIRVVRAAQTIEAVNLDAKQARLLDQAVGAAAIRVSRVSFTDRGQAVEYAETVYRSDRYAFDVVVEREEA